MDKEGQELEKVEKHRRQTRQVIDADILFFSGFLQFKERAKERVLHIVDELFNRRLIGS